MVTVRADGFIEPCTPTRGGKPPAGLMRLFNRWTGWLRGALDSSSLHGCQKGLSASRSASVSLGQKSAPWGDITPSRARSNSVALS
jgi:hypothetical protein